MEDVYTIKVKTKPDTRNLYPSERRYSASTVSGLAWVHIALAATALLLACLAFANPQSESKGSEDSIVTLGTPNLTLSSGNDTNVKGHSNVNVNQDIGGVNFSNALNQNIDGASNVTNQDFEGLNVSDYKNDTDIKTDVNENKPIDNNYMLVTAGLLITVFALAAGVSSILASVKWYVDRYITWLFVISVLSTLASLTSFIMIATWFVTSEDDISEFYKDKVPFKEYIIVKTSDVLDRNASHMLIRTSNDTKLFTKRVLSINILIAAFLEFLWSLLSVKIAYKGMRNNYKDDDRRGNCVSVVTTIKGNTNMPRNGKLLNSKPDLIDYPNRRIKKFFLAQNDNGFYLKNQNGKKNTETSSEFYKERMNNFLNRCASLEAVSNPEEVVEVNLSQSEPALNPIPEVASVEINIDRVRETPIKDRMTPISWGDTPDHTIYNQNNLNLDRIFNFKSDRRIQDGAEAKKTSEMPVRDEANESAVFHE